MISKIELKLIDEDGNYSSSNIDYKGYNAMLRIHNINMLVDVMNSMVEEYNKQNKMNVIVKKHEQ